LAKKPDHLADLEADDAGGVLSGLLAEENELDRRTLWRIASWGLGATCAVILAIMANQSSLGVRRDQVAAADLTRQAQQIQTVAKDTHNEARRLAAAIETLNMDRDRLYSRVTSLEQGLDSVTGAIAKQSSTPTSPPAARSEPQPSLPVGPVSTAPAAPAAPDKTTAAEPAPVISKESAKADVAKVENGKPDTTKSESAKADMIKPEPVKPSPATPLMAAPSMMAPPDPAAGRLVELGKAGAVVGGPLPDVVASTTASGDADADDTAPKISLQRTEFGVDLGGANSVNGLRALWRGLLKSRSNAPLLPLRPIIVIKEATNGLGMQLRLVAGPLNDAGAAARICAVLAENNRPCETTVFDGQRLQVKSDDAPAAAKPPLRRRAVAKRAAAVVEEAAKKPEPQPAATQAALSSIFSKKKEQ
jgi:hypothetical protein